MSKECPKLFMIIAGRHVMGVLAHDKEDARTIALSRIANPGEHELEVNEVGGPVGTVSIQGYPPVGPFPLSRRFYEESPALAMALPAWEAAMGSCFHFEVAVRLVAQKHLRGKSITEDIGFKSDARPGLLKMLFDILQFDDDEKAFLPKCNLLRNKIIHCEQDALQTIVSDLLPDFQPVANVSELRLPTNASGEQILAALRNPVGSPGTELEFAL